MLAEQFPKLLRRVKDWKCFCKIVKTCTFVCWSACALEFQLCRALHQGARAGPCRALDGEEKLQELQGALLAAPSGPTPCPSGPTLCLSSPRATPCQGKVCSHSRGVCTAPGLAAPKAPLLPAGHGHSSDTAPVTSLPPGRQKGPG